VSQPVVFSSNHPDISSSNYPFLCVRGCSVSHRTPPLFPSFFSLPYSISAKEGEFPPRLLGFSPEKALRGFFLILSLPWLSRLFSSSLFFGLPPPFTFTEPCILTFWILPLSRCCFGLFFVTNGDLFSPYSPARSLSTTPPPVHSQNTFRSSFRNFSSSCQKYFFFLSPSLTVRKTSLFGF